jgi:hypothetical protein
VVIGWVAGIESSSRNNFRNLDSRSTSNRTLSTQPLDPTGELKAKLDELEQIRDMNRK